MKKHKYKIAVVFLAVCLALSFGVIGVLAVTKLSFGLNGTIDFIAKGVNAVVSQGHLENGTLGSGGPTNPFQSFEITESQSLSQITSTTQYKSWSTVKLKFDNTNPETTLSFSITNTAPAGSGKCINVCVNSIVSQNSNLKISTSGDSVLVPQETREFYIVYTVKDANDTNSFSADFSVDFTLARIMLDEVPVLTKQGLVLGATGDYANIYYITNTETGMAKAGAIDSTIASASLYPFVQQSGKVFVLTEVDSSAFEENTSLGMISLPNTIRKIGDSAFSNCTSLTQVNIPEKVVEIGSGAFGNCPITDITIPSTVEKIGRSAFELTLISNIHIPESVTYVGASVLGGTPWYENLPDGPIYFNNVFNGYKGEAPDNTAVEIREGTTIISDRAFSDASNVKDVIVPTSVEKIEYYAFNSTDWADTWAKGPKYINNVLVDYVGTMPSNTSLVIEEGTVAIADSALSNCYNLVSVTLPSTLKSIGDSAFSYCSGLTQINLPAGLETIEDSAFFGCGITQLRIPASVKNIGYSICDSATTLVVDGNNKYYDSRNNCNAVIESKTGILVSGSLGATIIPNGVQEIGENAYYAYDITSISIPSSVKMIGDMAFAMTKVQEITLPEGVEILKSSAFNACRQAGSLSIPSTLCYIGDTILSMAFGSMESLVTINVNQANPYYDSRSNCNSLIITKTNELILGTSGSTIPSGVTTIGEGAFSDCEQLTSITIPSSVKTISNRAFSRTGLQRVTIPSSVTFLGFSAFSDCRDLQTVTIQGNTEIGEGAFRFCSSLTTVTMQATNPPAIGHDVFLFAENIRIIVPSSSLAKYQTQWSEYSRYLQSA